MPLEFTGFQRILKFLTDEAIQQKEFNEIGETFQFFIKTNYEFDFKFKFEIGRFLVQLLFHHSVLLPRFSHKVIAMFLLYDLYNWPTKTYNPFNGVIYDILNISNYQNSAIYFQFIHDFNKFFREKFQNFHNKIMMAFFEDYFDIIDKFDFLIKQKNFESPGIFEKLICDNYTNSAILHTKLQVLSKHIRKAIRKKFETDDIFRNSDLIKMHDFIEKISQTNENSSNDTNNHSSGLDSSTMSRKTKPDESTTPSSSSLYDEEILYPSLKQNHGFIPKYFLENFEKPIAVDIYTVFEFPQLPIIAKNFFISLYLMEQDHSSKVELLELTPMHIVACDFLPREVSSMKGFRKIFIGENYRFMQNTIFENLFAKSSVTPEQDQSSKVTTSATRTLNKEEFLQQISSFQNQICLYYFPFFPPIKTSENEHFDFDDPEEKTNTLLKSLLNINYDIDLEYFMDNYLVNLKDSSRLSSEFPDDWQQAECNDKSDDSKEQEINDILKKSCSSSLTMSEQKFVLTKLKSDYSLTNLEIDASSLPGLVENNPVIAHELLSIYIRESPLGNSPDPSLSLKSIREYLSTLVDMDTSVHSMEVVNSLLSEIPTEFIYRYISNCIRTCENIKDKYMQNRLVRLVCVFLSALIRKQIIDVNDIFLEVQSFCIEFSQIRDAATLFRFLKQLETNKESVVLATTPNHYSSSFKNVDLEFDITEVRGASAKI